MNWLRRLLINEAAVIRDIVYLFRTTLWQEP